MQIFAWVQELVQNPNDYAVAPEHLQAREEYTPRDFVAQVDCARKDVESSSPTFHPILVDLWQRGWLGGIRPAVVALPHPVLPQCVDIRRSDANDFALIYARFNMCKSVRKPGPDLGENTQTK